MITHDKIDLPDIFKCNKYFPKGSSASQIIYKQTLVDLAKDKYADHPCNPQAVKNRFLHRHCNNTLNNLVKNINTQPQTDIIPQENTTKSLNVSHPDMFARSFSPLKDNKDYITKIYVKNSGNITNLSSHYEHKEILYNDKKHYYIKDRLSEYVESVLKNKMPQRSEVKKKNK